MWNSLGERMRGFSYLPDISFVHDDVDDEIKEEILCGHSEKQAIIFGLMVKENGMPLHGEKLERLLLIRTVAKLAVELLVQFQSEKASSVALSSGICG
ncbi:hypothetical protein DITRI_Ditri11bG0080600 [Diplodiscus trichospermus]